MLLQLHMLIGTCSCTYLIHLITISKNLHGAKFCWLHLDTETTLDQVQGMVTKDDQGQLSP